MTSPRTEVAAFLTAALPDYRVIPYYRDLDGSEGITLLVSTDSIARNRSQWIATVTVWVVTDHLDVEQAEDALDEAIADVLAALNDKTDAVDLTANRVALQDTQHAYTVSISIPLKDQVS